MKINSHLIKKYPLSCVCIAIIWYLCFFTPPHTKLDNVAFIDKWVHITMYCGACSVIWYEYIRQHKKLSRLSLFLFAWLAPVLMSGLIELLQEYCTGGRRSGDWLDFAANSTGATLAVAVGLLLSLYVKRKEKD